MAPPRHAPPPNVWRAGTGPARSAGASVQPARAFAAHQRPEISRKAAPGDELVALGDGRFQLRSQERHVLSKPSGSYNFVRVQGLTRNQGTTMLSAQAPHAALAAGRPVLYAGTATFRAGTLEWWSNYSGTYQPLAEFSRQAALPPDRFVPWQKLQLGGLGMQRGMLHDRRRAETPTTEAGATARAKNSPPAGMRPSDPAPKSEDGPKPHLPRQG